MAFYGIVNVAKCYSDTSNNYYSTVTKFLLKVYLYQIEIITNFPKPEMSFVVFKVGDIFIVHRAVPQIKA